MNSPMFTVRYLGDLRTEMLHVKSGSTTLTDAPVDNQGKGEAFSPTDLVSAALASCAITIMGQVAQREGIALAGLTAEVMKVMHAGPPRKIQEIKVRYTHANLPITEVQRKKLIHAAHTCPVAMSLSADVKQTFIFDF